MTFLPILQRELIEASRRRGTYWIRVGVAAAGLVIGAWVMVFPELRVPSRIGMALFIPLAIVAMIYCALIGVFRTADCLSEEKREGTLGLLFLTDLKGYDIVVGKLAATSLNAAYGLLAMFPVLAIPLLAGGVTLAEFGRVVLVSVNTLFFSLAIGMFCSAINRDERRAMVCAFLLIFFFVIGLPIAVAFAESSSRWRGTGLSELLAIPSPYMSALLAFDSGPRLTKWGQYFIPSVITIHVMGWLFLTGASLIVPRTWQDRPLGAVALRRRQQLQEFGAGPDVHRTRRRHLLDINPIYWLVVRGRFKMAFVWGALAAGALAWIIGLIVNPSDWKDEVAYFITAVVAHVLLKFWVVTEACRRFSLDRLSGALELLLSTPLPVREIVGGQVLGLEKQFVGPVFVVLLADFIFLMAGGNGDGWTAAWAAGMIVFLADMFTLGWLGMWSGLNSRRPERAAAAGLVRVLVLPWILIAMVMTGIEVMHLDRTLFRSNFWDDYGPSLLYLTVSLGLDALFGLPARRGLLTRFREVATRRFEGRGRARS